VKKWLGVLAVTSLCVACGGGQPDPEAAAAAENPAAEEPGLLSRAAAAVGVAQYREYTVPAGTTLRLRLQSAVASDSSSVEDTVRAELREAIAVDGREVIPAGAEVVGNVTDVERSGRVQGRARLAYRFNSVQAGETQYDISTATISHQAEATKGEDATKIAIGAGAGAALGAILGGGDGAAKGAAIGGAAGTGAVLATRGEEVRLGSGATVTARLTAPLTVRVRTN
jgi:hypothetical protein